MNLLTKATWLLRQRRLHQLIPLCLLVWLPLCSLAQLREASVFSDDMVLQRSNQTLLWGIGAIPGNQVWARCNNKGKKWTANADEQGFWAVIMDLSQASSPCTLTFGEAKKSGSRKLSNVHLGDVWLIAGWQGQGKEAAPSDIVALRKERVRFLDLTGFRTSREAALAPSITWEKYPEPGEHKRFSSLAIHLGEFLAVDHHVGIVQLSTAVLEPALLDASAALTAMNPDVARIEGAWNRTNFTIREAETNRWHQLIAAKREGIVVDIPCPVEYSPPSVLPEQAFSPSQPPAIWMSFRGVIWSNKPKAQ